MAIEESPHAEYDRGYSNGWNACAARTQPAQVLQCQCGECGKKASEGWALYCVACMEVAGLPAVTDKPADDAPKHTSLVRTPDCTVQPVTSGEVPRLSDAEWMNIVNKNHAWFGYTPEDVAHEVFKLTEAALIAKIGAKP